MRRILILLTGCALVLWAVAPSGAGAQDNAGLGQYQENIPGAGGGGSGGGGSGGGGGGSGGVGGSGSSEPSGSADTGRGSLPADTVAELESLGDDGAAAADLATGTSPEASASGGSGADESGGGSGRGSGSQDQGASAGSAAGSSVASRDSAGDSGLGLGKLLGRTVGGSDSGGLGPALPIIIGVVLLAAVAVFIARRRGRLRAVDRG